VIKYGFFEGSIVYDGLESKLDVKILLFDKSTLSFLKFKTFEKNVLVSILSFSKIILYVVSSNFLLISNLKRILESVESSVITFV